VTSVVLRSEAKAEQPILKGGLQVLFPARGLKRGRRGVSHDKVNVASTVPRKGIETPNCFRTLLELVR
jgi:hypothetical protein